MTALSPREIEVAHLVSRGYRNAQVAAELGIQVVTVKNHLQRVFQKLQVTNRTQLALLVFERQAA